MPDINLGLDNKIAGVLMHEVVPSSLTSMLSIGDSALFPSKEPSV